MSGDLLIDVWMYGCMDVWVLEVGGSRQANGGRHGIIMRYIF